jgi:WD40 repeat protein
MGVVYHARQERPRRDVALKVMRRGLFSARMVRRFEAEAEMLGRLHHPGIAQVYEAGTWAPPTHPGETARTYPYIAMELVRGQTFTDFCLKGPASSTRDRLALVAKVCDAVQHAHQNGIIHRDLKPANIIVTPEGAPKVLDFGIARAADPDVERTTIRTGIGQLIGTLPYMSPEQVSGDPLKVDTRSDVYALGVIIFQVLTGKLPFDLTRAALPEAVRAICEQEAPRLSTVDRLLRGDVETIVRTAMEKDPRRRYQSAAALADDLRRYLAGEPLVARQDSTLYVLRKQMRRYRGLLIAGGLALAATVALGVVASLQAARADRNARSALASLNASEIERGRLLGSTGSMNAAEETLWTRLIAEPDSRRAAWALWELYANHPARRTFSLMDFDSPRAALAGPGGGAPDGALVFLDLAGKLVSYDYRTGKPFWVTDQGKRPVSTGLAISPDRTRLFLVTDPEQLVTVDPNTGAVLTRTRLPAMPDLVTRWGPLRISPDGRTLVVLGTADVVLMLNPDTGATLGTLRTGDGQRLSHATFSPDGSRLAVGGSANTAFVLTRKGERWTTPEGAIDASVAALKGHTELVTAMTFVNDGASVLSASTDRSLRLWDPNTGTQKDQLSHNNGHIGYLHPIPGTPQVLMQGWWATEVWDLSLRQRVGYHNDRPAHVFLTDGGKQVVSIATTTGNDRLLRTWDLDPMRCLTRLASPSGELAVGPLATGAVSASGKLAATGGFNDGYVTVWDMASRTPVRRLGGHAGRVRNIEFLASDRVVVSCGEDARVIVTDLAQNKELARLTLPNRALRMVALPGRDLVVVTGANRFHVIDAQGKLVRQSEAFSDELTGVAASPDGRILATVHRPTNITLWDTQTWAKVAQANTVGPTWTISSMHDGSGWIVGTWEPSIEVFDAKLERRVRTLRGHTHLVTSVSSIASPLDGTALILSTSVDGSLRLWDGPTGDPLAIFMAHEGGSYVATPAPASLGPSRVITAGADGALSIWDLSHYLPYIREQRDYWVGRLKASKAP